MLLGLLPPPSPLPCLTVLRSVIGRSPGSYVSYPSYRLPPVLQYTPNLRHLDTCQGRVFQPSSRIFRAVSWFQGFKNLKKRTGLGCMPWRRDFDSVTRIPPTTGSPGDTGAWMTHRGFRALRVRVSEIKCIGPKLCRVEWMPCLWIKHRLDLSLQH
ncbi:hypothetical protein C8F04DRAFT_1153654, partial [Mycena alexandri]